jgi:hypothetical protein
MLENVLEVQYGLTFLEIELLVVITYRDHVKNQANDKDLIIICIRDPLKRFVSAFNYAYDIINYDVSSLNINSNLKHTIASDLLKKK